MVLTKLTMFASLTTMCRHGVALLEVADITTQQAASNSPVGHYSLAFFCDVAHCACVSLCRRGVDLHRLQCQVNIA